MDKRKIIEWHPAFEASIQIEFENENWKNDIWTGTFIIETANADWWIGD